MFSNGLLQLFEAVRDYSKPAGSKVYIVGGLLRDTFLSLNPGDADADFIVDGDGIEFAKGFLKISGGSLKTFEDFYTAKILDLSGYGKITEIDFASSRTEIYTRPGALPVVKLAPIKDDLKRRDFSINALAVEVGNLIDWVKSRDNSIESLKKMTLDFFNGLKDIEERKIKILHENSFRDDPTRIYRAIRYAARIDGKLESQTELILIEAVKSESLGTVSKQRTVNELKKILMDKNLQISMDLLSRYGIVSALSLFTSEKAPQVTSLLKKAQALNSSDDELFYQAALRIFSYCGYDAGKNALNLGSNELKRIAFDTGPDLNIGDKQTAQRLTKAGLIFQELLRKG